MKQILAVPSDFPGGLAAEVSAHFGHCDAFTIVSLADGAVETVKVLAAPDHASGGCITPVRLLAEAGITAIAAGGMGRRPLLAFLEAGIPLYVATGLDTVGDVVSAFRRGQLPAFAPDGCCGGQDHAHGEHAHGEGEGCCGGHDHDDGDGGCCH